MIIVNKGQLDQYRKILPDGKNLGIKINYLEQSSPKGLPDAFILGEKFIGKNNVALILGDNFFYGQFLSEKLIKCTSNKKIKIKKFGSFDLKTFRNKLDGSEHYAITKGKFTKSKASRVRVISVNVLNSFFNFNKDIFKNSLKHLNKFNNFALILIKGTNLNPTSSENNKILRYYGIGAQIIKELKIKKMILVSRSIKRVIALDGYGIKITKQEIMK